MRRARTITCSMALVATSCGGCESSGARDAAASSVSGERDLAGTDVIELMSFAGVGREPPDNWRPFRFDGIDRATEYATVKLPDGPALRGRAVEAASALRTDLGVSSEDFPEVSWSWKVDAPLGGGDASVLERDDCAARVILLYEFEPDEASVFERAKFSAATAFLGEEPPGSVLMYVWDDTLPVGEPVVGPRSDRVRVLALRSGREHAGRWVTERRNHVEDYRRAFGADPPALTHVSILVDTDDTRGHATAWFRGLRLIRAGE